MGELINVFVSFDRLQFYWFHKRKYSYYYQIFLENIQILKEMQGSLMKGFLKNVMPLKIDQFENSLASADYKNNYASYG